jgi:hypothetical protein
MIKRKIKSANNLILKKINNIQLKINWNIINILTLKQKVSTFIIKLLFFLLNYHNEKNIFYSKIFITFKNNWKSKKDLLFLNYIYL